MNEINIPPMEDFEGNADRLVVTVLGKRLGHAAAWLHYTDWTVVTPGFEPEQGFYDELALTPEALRDHGGLALVIDFYHGVLLVVHGVYQDQDERGLAPVVLVHYNIKGSKFERVNT
jgi:hypothetical protein